MRYIPHSSADIETMLKKIGATARKDIEDMVGSKVLLKLFVKVTKDWANNERILTEFGY